MEKENESVTCKKYQLPNISVNRMAEREERGG